MLVTERHEIGVENKNGIFGITGMAGLLKRAAALLPVTAHKVPVWRVGDTGGGFREQGIRRPRAGSIEASLFQQSCGCSGPACRSFEFVLECGLLLIHFLAGTDGNHSDKQEGMSLRI